MGLFELPKQWGAAPRVKGNGMSRLGTGMTFLVDF